MIRSDELLRRAPGRARWRSCWRTPPASPPWGARRAPLARPRAVADIADRLEELGGMG